MFLSADTLNYILGLGLDGAQLVELVRRLETDAQSVAPVRSSAADRQARYRARKRNGDVTDDTQQRDVTPLSEGSPGFPRPLPTPPNLSQEPPIVPQKASKSRRKGDFAKFWAEYPLKVGKGKAEPAYRRALGRCESDDPEAEILEGLGRCRPLWEPEYIPHPSTWLNRDGWLDQLVPEETGAGATGPPKFDLGAFEARRAEREREQAA